MICVSIAEPTLPECLAAVKGLDLAEIRIDRTALSLADVRAIFGEPIKLIATCRPGSRTEEDRKAALLEAINAGAAYVDLELDADAAFREAVLAEARIKSCRVIISYHNFQETPPELFLVQIVQDCFARGGDIAKVVCRVRAAADCIRILSLYGSKQAVIALGLGDLGVITRIAAPFFGAPLTYACLAPGKETAEGQPDIKTLETIMRLLKHG